MRYTIFREDLHESWINEDFEDILPSLDCDDPKDIANKIERKLVEDMKQESKDPESLRLVRQIIIKIEESKDWERWFGQINEKKAAYTFSMKSGEVQKGLFSLMDIDDGSLVRLAKLSETGDIELMLDKMERQQELDCEREARFNHLHAIGKHIEDVLRTRIGDGLVKVGGAEDDTMAEDVQDGQDIIVRVKKDEQWKDVFYVEVKSKWDFTDPAHMSAHQIRRAVLHPDDYALCCVDLRSYKDNDLRSLPEDTIISCTRVKLDIGKKLEPMMQSILKADEQSDDVQIKISEYRSDINAKVFAEGKPVKELIDVIVRKINEIITCDKLSDSSSPNVPSISL